MSQLTETAAQALQTLMADADLTDKECSEILEIREGVKWARSTVHSKRSGATPLSLDDIEVLAKFFEIPPSFFLLDKYERLIWLGESRWCAPWLASSHGDLDIRESDDTQWVRSHGLSRDPQDPLPFPQADEVQENQVPFGPLKIAS